MSSTYSTGLRIELQASGANSGTWGTITNNNFSQVFEFLYAEAAVMMLRCSRGSATAGSPLAPLAPHRGCLATMRVPLRLPFIMATVHESNNWPELAGP